MKKLFTKEQEEFILTHYLDLNYKQIAQQLGGYTATQIAGWLHNKGYKKGHSSIFSIEEQNFIRNNYLIMSYKDIATHLGYTERQIRSWINHNCNKKLREFNTDYFHEIKEPNQAYWLGFIFADGWITHTKNNSYELGIELNEQDKQQLIDFNNELGGQHVIKHAYHQKYICGHHSPSATSSVCIRIYSKQIFDDLVSHNICECKTLKPDFPIVEDKLFFDFLRGYLDGDGCIYVNSQHYNKSCVHFTASHNEVLKYIQQKMLQYNIQSSIYQEKERKYRLYFNYQNALSLLDLIYYSDQVQKLQRKYDKYKILKGSLN